MNVGILFSSFCMNSLHDKESVIEEDICTGYFVTYCVLALLESVIDSLKLGLELIKLGDAFSFRCILRII